MKDLMELRRELMAFRVLDPACGSGNFLYVSYRELARLDIRIVTRLKELLSPREFQRQVKITSSVSPRQFYGLDVDSFGVELAKVTLMLAKKLAIDEAVLTLERDQRELPLHSEEGLPLDNLDQNIRCADALFTCWPEADTVIGNPPYQSKNKIQGELDPVYLNSVRRRHPEIDGRADYCVYWFRLAHDHLKPGQRAGLVGTNTVRQNYSREGGLDYIVATGGTITEAVSSMIWPGEAVVHVSVVNWIKDQQDGLKRLHIQDGNDVRSGWRHADFERIGPSLSFALDVSQAKALSANARAGCFQGQTHGHKAFLMHQNEAKLLIARDPSYAEVLFPYLIGDDLLGELDGRPTRYVIDFHPRDLLEAQGFKDVFPRIQAQVLPARQKAAEKERKRNEALLAADPGKRVNMHHANFLRKWWQFSYCREDMLEKSQCLPRYIACSRTTKRPIFDFISPKIHPNDALQVFALDDDYSFGILHSSLHWIWFTERCSTLKSDPRYTSNTVFDSFPWPQAPTVTAIKKVAALAVSLRQVRRKLREVHRRSFRDLYRQMELPGDNPLKDAQAELDEAVRAAYGFGGKDEPLGFLLNLNFALADREADGQTIQAPGLPAFINDKAAYVTPDCVEAS